MSDEHTAIIDRLQSTEQRLKAEILRQISILQDLKKDQVSIVSHCSVCRGGLDLVHIIQYIESVWLNYIPPLLSRIDQVSGPRS